MKFLKLLSTACALSLCITACASTNSETNVSKSDEKVTLTVFAAASLTESLQEIAEIYTTKTDVKNVDIVFSFDSSGTLKTQIEQGAVCDLFISAAPKQMNELDITSDENPDKLDFIDPETRIDLMQNEIVLIAPENSDTEIYNFEKVNEASLISLGNSDVPVGQYSEQIFKNLNIWDELNSSNKISFASNVKEVVSQVASGAVDCGVVYATDVTPDVKIIAKAPKGTYEPVIYPAAVTKSSKHPDEAKAFLDFLSSETGSTLFSSYGFKTIT